MREPDSFEAIQSINQSINQTNEGKHELDFATINECPSAMTPGTKLSV
jgi:hypothetical protein